MLDPAGRGGVSRMAAELYAAMERWGWAPSLLYLSASPQDGLFPHQLLRRGRFVDMRAKVNRGMRGLAVGHLPAHFYALASFWPYPRVRRYLRTFDAHVVIGSADRGITHALFRQPYLCWLATTLADEFTARARLGDEWARALLASPQWRVVRWAERWTVRRAALVLALSEHTAARARALAPEAAPRVRVMPCPVDTDLFRPAARSAPHANDPLILFVGRAGDARKNVPLLLAAFARAYRQQPSARLRIVGGATASLHALAQSLGVVGAVEVVPSVEHGPELAAHYRDADVLALSSAQEGLGIVIQEAMAAGLPVVSTKCGGPESIVRHGHTGYLVPSGDAQALAEAMLSVITDAGRRREMGRAARAVAEREFARGVLERRFREAFAEAFPRLDGAG